MSIFLQTPKQVSIGFINACKIAFYCGNILEPTILSKIKPIGNLNIFIL